MQKAIRKPRRATWFVLVAVLVWTPQVARAEYEPEDFRVRSAQDLVDLCSVKSSEDPVNPSIQFCRGFISGAWQYHLSQANGPKGQPLVCPPEPPPTRDEAIAMFVAWSATHADKLSEPAVDALFRFLVEKYPCPVAAAAKKGASK
jgi:hypothetical protein